MYFESTDCFDNNKLGMVERQIVISSKGFLCVLRSPPSFSPPDVNTSRIAFDTTIRPIQRINFNTQSKRTSTSTQEVHTTKIRVTLKSPIHSMNKL